MSQGLLYQVQVLKVVGAPTVGFKPFTPWGKESSHFEFPPNLGSPAPGWGYSESVSQPLLPGGRVFLIYLLCRSHSAPFWGFFQRTLFYRYCRLGGSLGGEFRMFLCCHLEPKSSSAAFCKDSGLTWFIQDYPPSLSQLISNHHPFGHVMSHLGDQDRDISKGLLFCLPPLIISPFHGSISVGS